MIEQGFQDTTNLGNCTEELTVLVTACTRPEKAQARQKPQHSDGGRHGVSLLAEELLAFGSFCERKSPFSLII